MPLLVLTANDRYYLGPLVKALRRVLNAHGHCANKLNGAVFKNEKVAAAEWVYDEPTDAQADRSELVNLLHALEDAERGPVPAGVVAPVPVARPASPEMVHQLYPEAA